MFRDLKRKMREDLHAIMRVPALYYPTGNPDETPNTVSIRPSYGPRAIGNEPGTDYHFANMLEMEPKVLFMVAEQMPARLAVVSISPTEVYRVDSVEPIDFISIKAVCVKANDADAALFGYPGDMDWPASLWSQ